MSRLKQLGSACRDSRADHYFGKIRPFVGILIHVLMHCLTTRIVEYWFLTADEDFFHSEVGVLWDFIGTEMVNLMSRVSENETATILTVS